VTAGCSNVSAKTPAKAKRRVTPPNFEVTPTIPGIGQQIFPRLQAFWLAWSYRNRTLRYRSLAAVSPSAEN
jgi:hypothetical protein